jgi:Predicted transcription factor, homolog of eukaryotic MBF1
MFGDIVNEIRKQLGITQEQLARELNISFSTINRWENSHTVPSHLAKMRLVEFCEKNSISPDIIGQINSL